MNDYVVEYYEINDPVRIFIWETKADTKVAASVKFHKDPENMSFFINDIKDGKWDRENFKIIN